jgi:DNA-binding beta-propeller fold protein YncE
MASARGLIAVDKKGGKVLFLNPVTFETEVTLDGFEKTVHELLVIPETNRAYVPVFGNGIHGRNPIPQHMIHVFDLERRTLLATIDLHPLSAPHAIKLGPDGLIYVTCENSARIAVIDRQSNTVTATIDAGSANCHRMVIAPDGHRIYTENEEDATISVIGFANRNLLGKIATPRSLAGIAVSGDSGTIVAVDDEQPALFLFNARSERLVREVRLIDVPKAAQIARYAPDWSSLAVTSLNSNSVSLIDPSFDRQVAIPVGSQPMDMAFHGDDLFIACQGDGSVHVVDLVSKRHKHSFAAGTGCECLGFY